MSTGCCRRQLRASSEIVNSTEMDSEPGNNFFKLELNVEAVDILHYTVLCWLILVTHREQQIS